MGKRRQAKKLTKSRRLSFKAGIVLLIILVIWGIIAEWFVHHPRRWIDSYYASYPVLAAPLLLMGNPLADITDGIGITGHDAIYEYDTEKPTNSVTFAGLPIRVGEPAPDDIQILDRGEFKIGWSATLRRPVWCAYHVVKDANYPVGVRPSGFTKDKALVDSPAPNEYTKSGYDRGHMAPNYAIVTRYGTVEQKKTFMMSNVAPQRPTLNRGVWRILEHQIADFWTARYGEIWVIVGAIPGDSEIGETGINIPESFYQLIIAQEDMNVRALAVLIPQQVSWNHYAARDIISIDELEELTGLDFNHELPDFIQRPLEAELPSRLWPIRPADIFKLIYLRLR